MNIVSLKTALALANCWVCRGHCDLCRGWRGGRLFCWWKASAARPHTGLESRSLLATGQDVSSVPATAPGDAALREYPAPRGARPGGTK